MAYGAHNGKSARLANGTWRMPVYFGNSAHMVVGIRLVCRCNYIGRLVPRLRALHAPEELGSNACAYRWTNLLWHVGMVSLVSWLG